MKNIYIEKSSINIIQIVIKEYLFIKLNKLNNSVDIAINKPTISEVSTKASLILDFVPLISKILNFIFFFKDSIFLITAFFIF